jgi:Flp pilus assembly protein TadB
MKRYESLRASDADRDAVTERLRDAAGEGRLEPEELEERVNAALRARTYGELGLLVADLPPDGDPAWPGSRSRGAALTRFALVGTVLVATITVAVVVIAVVVLLVLAVATLAVISWIAFVLFWLAFRRTRRRRASDSVWRRDVGGRHVRRASPTGFL